MLLHGIKRDYVAWERLKCGEKIGVWWHVSGRNLRNHPLTVDAIWDGGTEGKEKRSWIRRVRHSPAHIDTDGRKGG
jgi:hypothetical protein